MLLVRHLQLGDPDGHMRRGLAAFPDQAIAQRILDRYFIAGGKAEDKPFASKPMVDHKTDPFLQTLLVAANFVEVFLAKENHYGHGGYQLPAQDPGPTDALAVRRHAGRSRCVCLSVPASPWTSRPSSTIYSHTSPPPSRCMCWTPARGHPTACRSTPADIFPTPPHPPRTPCTPPVFPHRGLAHIGHHAFAQMPD